MSKKITGMSEQLTVVVTSGGTDVDLDKVRTISNKSGGATGAGIGEEVLRRGHKLHFLGSRGSRRPFGTKLKANPRALNIEAECIRIRAVLEEVAPLMENFEDEVVRNFAEYHRRLLEIVSDPEVDAVVLAMAASDFAPAKTVEGKIDSKNGFVAHFERLPKIVDEIKNYTRAILVGFKYQTEDSTPDGLIETAYRALLRSKQDLTVANMGPMGTPDLLTYILTMERGVIPVQNRSDLPRILVEMIEQLRSKKHYKTLLSKVENLALPEGELTAFLNDIHDLSHLALFPGYLEDEREEFGFVAKRTDQGTLITSRGSSKSNATVNDLALVTDVNQEARIISVESLGAKASLNAPLAHLIFEEREDINYIVHSHICLPGAAEVELQSTPGTQEDWDRIKPLIDQGERVIHQPGHGVIILLKELDELIPILRGSNIYAHRPELYDDAYARFQRNTRFVETAAEQMNPDGTYLDMCAGTGEVTRQLFDRGFKNISLADASAGMLRVAQEKLPEIDPSRFTIQTFEGFSTDCKYDGILIRQAINYISPDKLVEVFKRLKTGLNDGGRLIFNSFTIDELRSGLKSTKRDALDSIVTLTQEGNLVEGGIIHHGQRTEVFNVDNGGYELVYDLNSFYLYDLETFKSALEKAGFVNINIKQEGRSIYISAF